MSEPKFIHDDEYASVIDFTDLEHIELPDEEWLVKDLLVSGGRMLLYGPTGHGKSFVALSMAMAVVQGKPFLQKFPTRKGRVVYFATDDMGLNEWQPRIKEFMPSMNGAAHTPGSCVMIQAKINPDVTDLSVLEREWAKIVRQVDPILVVVDTVSFSHTLDGNSNATPGQVYSAWRRIAGSRPSMLLVGFDRKKSMNPDFRVDFGESAAGAHEWRSLVSATAHVHMPDKHSKVMRFEVTKTPRNLADAIEFPVHIKGGLATIGTDDWAEGWRLLSEGKDDETAAKVLTGSGLKLGKARETIAEIREVMEFQTEMALDKDLTE